MLSYINLQDAMPALPQVTSDERRQSERAQIAIAVRQRIGGRTHLCQASNISTAGIFVAHVIEGALPAHGKCWLEFSLPGSNVLIAARGQVVRQKVHSRYLLAAIQFTSIAPSHRRMIGQYVEGPPVASPSPAFLSPHTH
jgi:hypothetical protein